MRLISLRAGLNKVQLGAILATGLVALAGIAYAQANYPSKPVRLVVGFAAGGPSDILARVASAAMSKTIGEQIYVETAPEPRGTSRPKLSRAPSRTGTRCSWRPSVSLSTKPSSRISNTGVPITSR